MNKIRVTIADDHGVLRAGVRSMMATQPDMVLVDEIEDARDVMVKVAQTTCDVLLLDLSLPGGGGLPLIGEITRAYPSTKVVVLTMHEHPTYLRSTRAAGAAGFLPKRAAGSLLLDAVRRVAHGGAFFDHSGVDDAPRAITSRAAAFEAEPRAQLSPREREVLELVATGFTNREAGEKLGVSVKTVEGYRSRLMRKLGANSRADLVRHAVRLGLFDAYRSEA